MTTTTSGAADLLDLIEAYAEARHKQGHSSYNAQTAAALQAVKDALAAGQATAAPAGDWLWVKLMDFCKKRGFAPANFNDLFEIADDARAARAPADRQPALDRDRIREIFMAHGFTVKEGQTDLKQYVYDAADALLRAARAQADSVQEDAARYRLLRRGQHWSVIDGIGNDLRAEALDAAVDAARKQAPASVLHLVHSAFAEIAMAFPKAFALHKVGIADTAVREALAAPAAQADSVLEDAARLDWLIEQRAYVVSDPDACPGHWLHWARPDGSTWVQGDEHPTPRAAIDAARKQGGA